jgi:tight adherence protein B
VPPSDLLFGLPPDTLLLVGGAMLLLPTILAFVLAQQTGSRARLRARLAAIASGAETRPALRLAPDRSKQIKTKLRESGHAGMMRGNRTVELRLRIERAGMTTSIRTFYTVSALCALVSAAIYLLLGFSLLTLPSVLAAMGIGLPRFYLSRKAKRRQFKFTQLFADAIDVMVRGIRSGLPVGECLNIIARESPEPLAAEFTLIIEGQRLGMTLKQALERACRRMPTADMKFFAVVLNLQQQTGGNLGETLAGLSSLLRGRKKMADKVRAMSSEARMTASIIGVLPFLIALVIFVINPGYMMLLWTDPMGNVILFGGLLWMAIGVFIMKQMISFEI